MKLLKLVPDHTNLDFMRWRNLALVLSLIATVASIAFTVYRGLNLGVDFVGGQLIRVDIRAADRRRAAAHAGSTRSSSAKPASRSSAGRRPSRSACPSPPGGDAAANVAATSVKPTIEKDYPGAADRRGRDRFRQGQRGAGATAAPWPSASR